MIYGNRIMWPSITGTKHWEYRKGFTISGYTSEDFEKALDFKGFESILNRRSKLDQILWKSSAVSHLYQTSCVELFGARFLFYQHSMPAKNYRRTSIDFEINRLNDREIGAFVDKNDSKFIWLHDGIILSIEDAAQFYMAFSPNPLGLKFNSSPSDSFFLRYNARQHENSFLNYLPVKNEETGLKDSALLGKVIFDNFLGISKDLDRQLFADTLSVISLQWLIGHEDAHKYSGHLHHFEKLGINENDKLFDELISTVEDKSYTFKRRAAELEADTCSTMRLVDYCFDSELLGIVTDRVVPSLKRSIWQDTKESRGLEANQRSFLLRMLMVGATLPLAIFDIAFQKNPLNNHVNYPSFITRAFNIIFTTLSRAVDVSMNFPDHKVGGFRFSEFQTIFNIAIIDVLLMYKMIYIGMTGKDNTIVDEMISDSAYLSQKLFKAFMAYHGQSAAIGIFDKIKEKELDKYGIIPSLIRERHLMKLHQVEAFQDSKKIINNSRLSKTEEDIRLTLNRINLSDKAFDFLN